MSFETQPHRAGDILLSIPYVICLLVGVPSNFSALIYFLRKKRDLPTYLYILSSFNDMITNFCVIPIIASLWQGRRPALFSVSTVCTINGILIKMQASFSVFLVLVLSVTRSLVLVRPFMEISTRRVLYVVAVYGVYLVLQQFVPLITGSTTFHYTNTEVYCWDKGSTNLLDLVDIWLDTISLALPIVPVTISCIVSCTCVWRQGPSSISHGRRQKKEKPDRYKQKASSTIIIMTIVYIIFNLPLFVNYIPWLVIESSDRWTYPSPFYKSQFMYWYSWNITDCLCINLNSLMNPLVYFMRIEKFKEWINRKTYWMRNKVIGCWRGSS